MALISTNPIYRDGKLFDKLAPQVAFSPIWNESRVGVTAAVRLVPYAEESNSVTRLDEEAKSIVFADITQFNDRASIECLNEITVALQKYINTAGL